MKTIVTTVLLSLAAIGAASAHITLETEEAKVGAAYKAVFRVPHGCSGAATTAIRVQIPEGAISAKPMPKAGWELATVKGAYAKSYDDDGTATPAGVKQVVWSGGRLADDFYDEFVIRMVLTPSLPVGETLYFPVVQECEGGKTDRWIEIPAPGKGADDVETPAPGVRLLAKP